jgi:hypothetical protein
VASSGMPILSSFTSFLSSASSTFFKPLITEVFYGGRQKHTDGVLAEWDFRSFMVFVMSHIRDICGVVS